MRLTNKQESISKKTMLLTGFVLAKFALQYFLVSPVYELQRDEFLHLDQANHLAWGYLSVPPVSSWMATLIKQLGNSIFWIRFFPALFGALTLVAVWKAIEVLKGSMFALLLGATCILLSALLRLNGLFQPNSLDALCWTAFCFALVKYINSEHPKWLYAGMVVLAVGFLNKYSIVFLLIGLLPAILLTRRSLFADEHFYLSIALFLLLISPNLVWQFEHHFPVYQHMQALAKTQLVHVNRWLFLKDQVFFFIGSLPVMLAALYALLFYPAFRKYQCFFLAFVFTLIAFVYLRGKSYYAIGLYPIYIAFGAVYLENLSANWKRYVQTALVSIPVILFIPTYFFFFPNQSPEYIVKHKGVYKQLGLLRWEDGREHTLPQDYADMLGWKELAGKVNQLYAILSLKGNTLVMCDNYGQAGAINYYSTHKNLAAVSFHADYINWFKLDKPYVNLIRVKTLESEADELKETGPLFIKAFTADSVTNKFSREYKTAVFGFEGAIININERIKLELKQEQFQ